MMQYQKIAIYFNFYKTTLLINGAVSFAVSMFFFSFLHFAFALISVGFLMALFYKELTKQQEYYFYYNAGISKINLILVSFVFNLALAILLIFISALCKT